MKKFFKILAGIIGSLVIQNVALAQDLHFSQFFNNPLLTNPANTGFIPDADYRLGASYRNQYSNIMAQPYQSKLTYPDQFDGKFFDGGQPTSVVLANNNINYFDLQVGMNYAYFPTQDIYINAGYSIQHVNQPKETFFEDNSDNQISMRHIAFLNGLFKVTDDVIINPNIYYTT